VGGALGLRIKFLGNIKQREQFGAKIFETYAGFEVAHMSVNLVQRLTI